MANYQDWSVGISAAESAYGTAVVVSRHLEFTDPKPFTPDLGIKQGAGIRVGSRLPRSARRVTTSKQAAGDIGVEVFGKGLGLVLAACMGGSASTMVSTGLYQQVFTLADVLPSHTIQFGIPRVDGTIDPITYKGCVVSGFEIGGAVGEIATLKTSWDAQNWDTSTAYVTPSYPTGGGLLTVSDATIYSGTVTAPTTTALASATSALAGVKDFKVTVSNKLVADRFFVGAAGLKGKPLPGEREIKVEMNVEYGATALRDAFLGQTAMSLVITLGTGADQWQIVLSELKLDGDLPEGGPDAPPQQAIKATVLDNLTATQPIWIVARTSDTAL